MLNVFIHPFQSQNNIQNSTIARTCIIIACQVIEIKKPQKA